MPATSKPEPDRPGAPKPKLERAERWAGLRRGDPVRVAGVKMRGATWTFLAHVRNATSGEEWVEVVGGRSGDRTMRSFAPSQVYPPGTAKGGKGANRPSLADAPGLPL